MSYDITFKVKVEGVDAWVAVGDCEANITWNLRDMIERSTGLPWINEANNGLCKDVIPKIIHGRKELMNDPKKYEQDEAPNGWGTISGCFCFFSKIIEAWENFCQWNPELIDVATFWIE